MQLAFEPRFCALRTVHPGTPAPALPHSLRSIVPPHLALRPCASAGAPHHDPSNDHPMADEDLTDAAWEASAKRHRLDDGDLLNALRVPDKK